MMQESQVVRGTSPRRSFGTELTSSVVGNRCSPVARTHKKKVRLRTASKHRSDLWKHTTVTTTSVEAPLEPSSDLEYSVSFQPGPIGLKLEPVVVSGPRQVGCRVMKFVDGGAADPGQARASGRIRPGDLLMAVDGTDVMSWNYPDVIAFLKRRSSITASGCNVTFRTVWNQASVVHEKQNNGRNLLERKKQTPDLTISTTGSAINYSEHIDLPFISPSEAAYSHVLASFCQEDPHAQQNNFIAPQDLSMLSIWESCIGANASMITTDAAHPFTMKEDGQSNALFSPSKVKKLSASLPFDEKSESQPKQQISKVLSTVYNSVTPVAGIVATSSYNVTSSLISAMSTKLGEALVGHSSREFDQAIQLKMKLLTELSQVKVTLDAKEEEHARLYQSIMELSKAKEQETGRLQKALEDQKSLYENLLGEKEAELERLTNKRQMENELLQSEIDVVMERLHFYETRASDLNEKIGNVKLVREDICRNVHLKEDEKMKQVRQVTLVHLAKQVSFLTTELKQKDEELEEKNRVRTDLDSTLTVAINNSNAKEAIIQSLTKQVDSYALELKEVKDTLKAVSLQKETVDEMLKKTTSEFQEANTKIHELHVQYENACDEKMSASELFEKSQREQADLVASVASLRASLNERDLELAELRPQLVATKLDASESKQQLLMTLAELECAKMEVLSYEKNIPEEIQRLLGDLQRTSTELEQSKESVAALRSELDVMSAQDQAALSNQREESEFKIKSIQGRFDGVVIEKEKLMDQVLLLKLALDQMTLAANDSQLNLERTKLDLQSAVTVMKDMESSRDDTYTDMQVLQTDLYKARSELEQSENSIKLLREELEVVTANSQAALALQQDKFETDVEKLHSLMNELRADRDEAIGALDQSKQELVDCISRIDSLTIRQSETEQESQNSLENARASSEKQICQILDELANLQSQHLQLIADSTIKDQQLLSYETQVISMTKSTTAHLSKIDELKALSISTNSQFKIQLQDVGLLLAQAQATIQLLKNSNSLLDQEAKSLRSSEASLVQQVENLQSMLDEKEIQLAASAVDAMKKTVDVNFLSKDITEYRENGAHAQAQMRNCAASYSAQIASLMGQVGAQRSQLIAQTQLIESMKVETSEFDTRYRELVKDFEGDFEAMEKEMKGVIATNTVLDEKVLELQAKLTSSSSEFHSTKVTVKKLEDSLREAEIKIAAQEVIAEKTEKLESSLREAETKVAEQEVKSVTMKNLDDSLREAETKVAEHQENTAVKIKHLEDSLKEVETKEAELSSLSTPSSSDSGDRLSTLQSHLFYNESENSNSSVCVTTKNVRTENITTNLPEGFDSYSHDRLASIKNDFNKSDTTKDLSGSINFVLDKSAFEPSSFLAQDIENNCSNDDRSLSEQMTDVESSLFGEFYVKSSGSLEEQEVRHKEVLRAPKSLLQGPDEQRQSPEKSQVSATTALQCLQKNNAGVQKVLTSSSSKVITAKLQDPTTHDDTPKKSSRSLSRIENTSDEDDEIFSGIDEEALEAPKLFCTDHGAMVQDSKSCKAAAKSINYLDDQTEIGSKGSSFKLNNSFDEDVFSGVSDSVDSSNILSKLENGKQYFASRLQTAPPPPLPGSHFGTVLDSSAMLETVHSVITSSVLAGETSNTQNSISQLMHFDRTTIIDESATATEKIDPQNQVIQKRITHKQKSLLVPRSDDTNSTMHAKPMFDAHLLKKRSSRVINLENDKEPINDKKLCEKYSEGPFFRFGSTVVDNFVVGICAPIGNGHGIDDDNDDLRMSDAQSVASNTANVSIAESELSEEEKNVWNARDRRDHNSNMKPIEQPPAEPKPQNAGQAHNTLKSIIGAIHTLPQDIPKKPTTYDLPGLGSPTTSESSVSGSGTSAQVSSSDMSSKMMIFEDSTDDTCRSYDGRATPHSRATTGTSSAGLSAQVQLARPTTTDVLSQNQGRILENFTSSLKRKGIEVLKLSRDLRWQFRHLTVSSETRLIKFGQKAKSDHYSVPLGILWQKRFNLKGKESSVLCIDNQGHGGMVIEDLRSVAASTKADSQHPIPRKFANKFSDSVSVTITYSLGKSTRFLILRCQTTEEAHFVCTGLRVLIDFLRREKAYKLDALLTRNKNDGDYVADESADAQ